MNEELTQNDEWSDDQAPEEPASDEQPALHAVPSEEAPDEQLTGPGVQPARHSGSVDMNDLAARARDIADFITGHAATIRDYERRIAELEDELAKNRATTAEAKTQLAAVLQLVDVLKPAV